MPECKMVTSYPRASSPRAMGGPVGPVPPMSNADRVTLIAPYELG